MTENMICAMLDKNATCAPTCGVPEAMLGVANQTAATPVSCINDSTVGILSVTSRPLWCDALVKAAFATAKRACSASSRRKARITRSPVSYSHRMAFMRSI